MSSEHAAVVLPQNYYGQTASLSAGSPKNCDQRVAMMPSVRVIPNRLGARSGEFSMLPQIDHVACHYRGTVVLTAVPARERDRSDVSRT